MASTRSPNRVPLSPPLTELYWGFWWKPSNPFQSHSSGVNKIAFIWTPSGSTDLLYFDLSPNPWRIRCMNDLDRKSTRLNSSHLVISYAVFCLKKKKINHYKTDNIQCTTSII